MGKPTLRETTIQRDHTGAVVVLARWFPGPSLLEVRHTPEGDYALVRFGLERARWLKIVTLSTGQHFISCRGTRYYFDHCTVPRNSR